MAKTLERVILDPSCSSDDLAELVEFFSPEEKQQCRDKLAATLSQLLRINESVHSPKAGVVVEAFVTLEREVMRNALRKMRVLDPRWSPPHSYPREGYWNEGRQLWKDEEVPWHCDPLNYPFYYLWILQYS